MTETPLAPDEKLCPYCAETIKAAAIRCRYCGSDLAEEPEQAVEPVEVPDDDPARDDPAPATLLAEPEPDLDLPGAALVGRTSTGLRVVAALVVLCLVLAGGLWFLVNRSRHPHLDTAPNGQVTQSSFRNAAMSAASDAATQAFSYSYQTLDADRKKTEELLAPGSKAAKEYAAALDGEATAQITEAKVTQKATVLAAGVISAEEHSAKVLLFLNTTTTRVGSKNQQLKQSRVVVDLTRKDGDWTVTAMDPV